MSLLAKQIARSIVEEPERWTFKTLTLRRDDGVAVDVIKPFHGPHPSYARLDDDSRADPLFGWWDGRLIQGAFRQWQFRPLAQGIAHDQSD